MAIVNLSLESIGELAHGQAQSIIQMAIDSVADDIDDRGDDGQWRELHIIVKLRQRKNEEIESVVKAHAKLPSMATPSTTMALRKQPNGPARIIFQDMNPERVDQPTFPELDKDKKKKREEE